MDFEKQIAELKALLVAMQKQVSDGLMSKDTADEKFKAIAAQMAALEARALAAEEQLRKRANAMNGLDDDIRKGKAKFSLVQFIRGAYLNQWDKDNEQEKKIVGEYQAKTAMASTGGLGGYAIPPQAMMEFIEKLYAQTVLVKAGARVLTNLSGSPVTIPGISTGTTAYWIAENVAITESNIVDRQISMTPHECAALVKLSNKLIMLAGSNPSIEQLVQDDIATQIALAIDLAGLTGDGGSNNPTGVSQTGSINTHAIDTNGDWFDFDDAIDMMTELENDNAARGKLAFIMHPKVKQHLKKTRIPQYSGDTAGEYVVPPVLSDAMLASVLGVPFYTTTQLPTNLTKSGGTNLSDVILGNFEDLLIGQWGGLDIASSNVAGDANGGAFSANQTWIRAIQSVDIAVRHPESFCLASDAKTA